MSRKNYLHLSDEALLDYYYSSRNIRAFRLLYNRHKDSLYRYCVQMNASAADDVLEELWSGLLEQPPQLCGRLLRTWLYIRLNRLLHNRGQSPNSSGLLPPDNRLLCGIQQLPRIERNILLLHTEGRLPLATVADIENISLKHCRELYRSGKERLERFLYGSPRQPWRIKAVEEVTT